MDLNGFLELGFSHNESRVYVALVESGKLSAHALSKKLQLPRSTVYSVLNALEGKGLLRREPIRGTISFRVDNPEDLIELIAREERAVAQRKTAAKRLAAELRPMFRSKSYQAPKVEFYEGRERVEKFLNAYLPIWAESIRSCDGSTWGYQDHTFVTQFSRWIERCWQVLHVDHQIPGRILSNRSDIERTLRGKVPRREVRVLGREFDFKSSIWVMGEYVILILSREPPIVAFQIHNSTLADNLRPVFRFLYEQGSTDL